MTITDEQRREYADLKQRLASHGLKIENMTVKDVVACIQAIQALDRVEARLAKNRAKGGE